ARRPGDGAESPGALQLQASASVTLTTLHGTVPSAFTGSARGTHLPTSVSASGPALTRSTYHVVVVLVPSCRCDCDDVPPAPVGLTSPTSLPLDAGTHTPSPQARPCEHPTPSPQLLVQMPVMPGAVPQKRLNATEECVEHVSSPAGQRSPRSQISVQRPHKQ